MGPASLCLVGEQRQPFPWLMQKTKQLTVRIRALSKKFTHALSSQWLRSSVCPDHQHLLGAQRCPGPTRQEATERAVTWPALRELLSNRNRTRDLPTQNPDTGGGGEESVERFRLSDGSQGLFFNFTS